MSIIIPPHLGRPPVVEFSPRDLGAKGNFLAGMLRANCHWLDVMEEVLRKGDSGQKRAAREMIEACRDFIEEIKKDLADVSRYNKAIELFAPNDRDIRQDLQGDFNLSK